MKPRILYSVLNWGLGHASRSVPLVRSLSEIGFDVILVSDGDALELLRQEFPDLLYETLTGYKISYPFGSIFLNVLWHSFSITSGILSERMKIRKLIQTHKPEFIISDNRYGFRNRTVKSIMICHQITIHHKNKLVSGLANFMNRFLLKRFDEVWIPDCSDAVSLAGKLSDCSFPLNHVYIGPLSRMMRKKHDAKYDMAIVLSGPEPQRTYLEKILIDQLNNYDHKAILVRGVITDQKKVQSINNLDIIDFANAEELNQILNSSKLLIARSGYSTVMDAAALGIKAIFIPTPGQTEQEYLAEYLLDRKMYFSMAQDKFDLKHALKESQKYTNIFLDNPELAKKILELLKNRK